MTCTVAAAMVLPATPAAAIDQVNTQKLRQAVTVSGILGHERVFQRIANQNDGTRASGTSGYKASVDYVRRTLAQAGYDVRLQKFDFNFFQELAPAQLSELSPTPTDYQTETFEYSGNGDVSGALVATTDIQVPPGAEPSSSTSGCEPGDFPAAGSEPAVALIQRGTCTFEQKAANAAAAGYDAAIIFNEGQPGRTDLPGGTLGNPQSIPVVGLSYADGAALYEQLAAGAVTVRVATSTASEVRPTWNVIADSRGGDPNKVVVVGAHLDSVLEGPGINDNGSGSATILETAVQINKLGLKPQQKLRFAFWGAEEAGLLGSTHYVDSLSDQQLSTIMANLNFDMLGSPNYVRFVYDGDGSSGTAGPQPGSGQIEQIFTNYFAGQGLASAPTDFDGRSDYGPFIEAGIPAGGLFSGAEGIKTAQEAAIYGGTAGEPYDACYHQACDSIQAPNNNLSDQALAELGDAAAHAIWTLGKTSTGFYADGSRMAASQAVSLDQFDYRGGQLVR
ncbi:MAG: M20/M25/M40 family metallo-hydrolase [Nakamurella multipartita]